MSRSKVQSSNPGQGRNLDRDVYSTRTLAPPLCSQHRNHAEPDPSLETHQKVHQGGSTEWVQIRRNTNEIQWQVKKSEWKNTEIWKTKKKATNTNTGGSPGYHPHPNSLETHQVRK